jgi:hypothetical protein
MKQRIPDYACLNEKAGFERSAFVFVAAIVKISVFGTQRLALLSAALEPSQNPDLLLCWVLIAGFFAGFLSFCTKTGLQMSML